LLVPAMENRVFVAAIYPDGSPAAGCEVKLWHDPQPQPPQGQVLPAPGGGPPPLPPGRFPVAPREEPKPAAEKRERGPPPATGQANEAGLAEFRIAPKQEQFRMAEWAVRNVEMLGGQVVQVGGQKVVFDVYAEAKDGKGSAATAKAAINSEPFGENVLLRLD